MRPYIKNKNFIPTDFISQMNFKSDKNNNKLIVLLFIINIFIIPTSISKIINSRKSKEVVSVSNFKTEEKDVNKEKIIKAISLINDNVNSINIQNNFGFIEFNNIEEVFNIEKNEKFKINNLKVDSEKSLLVEVEL